MRRLSDGRQRRSREEWQEILARFERSGLSENRFCQQRGLTRKTFRTWRQRLASERTAGVARGAFVEMPVPEPRVGGITEGLERGSFELKLPGGVTLRWRA